MDAIKLYTATAITALVFIACGGNGTANGNASLTCDTTAIDSFMFYYKNKDWNDASRWIEKVKQSHKVNDVVLFEAECLAGTGHCDEAINLLKAAMDTLSDGRPLHYHYYTLGNVFYEKKDW